MSSVSNAMRGVVRGVSACVFVVALASCGGNDSQDSSASPPPAGTDVPTSRAAAARFLTQASFGPTEASIDRVMAIGYTAWINEQLVRPATGHQAHWERLDSVAKAASGATASTTIGQEGVFYSFWRGAVSGDDQLRQRVAHALSQIFVISMLDAAVGDNPRATAHYLDMLATKGLGNYRDLLEAVTLHPMMGRYLSSLGNRKADAATGRVPDENYAREVMQLFSIGLHELNLDGTVKTSGGNPTPTYTPADVAGLARVFTGWSWACPVAPTSTNSTCFGSGASGGQSDPERTFKPMINYPQQHAPEEKRFLGAVIPAGTSGTASLKTALDTLANHPNVAPFISKQLIQRLVTSNPSPAYVRDVAAVFNNSNGVRGDMRAVVRAILTHREAMVMSNASGKVREPLLRVSAYLRAFNAVSDSGDYKLGNTDDPATRLGQSAMRSPSVFNFYRPGYVLPGSRTAAAGLVSPELQIAHESSASGYVNYMRDAVSASGLGATNPAPLNRRDIQVSYSSELALATNPSALVDQLDAKLTYNTMPAALKTEIVTALNSITIPPTNQTNIDNAKRARVNAAVFLVLVSPEFLVQK